MMSFVAIKKRRQELGLTLDDVASAVGVNRSTVSRWERGEISNLKDDKIRALSQVLRVSPEYLLGWTSVSELRKPDSDILDAWADLSDQERRLVLYYINFIKLQREGV